MVSKPRSLKKLLSALGMALVASLALSAFAAGSASAAAPVNTALPVISATPHVGAVATTTNGSWTGSPTSYTYIWFRCNASGLECKSIAGATKASYTPIVTDAGQTLVTSVTASNAEGSNFAFSEPVKVATLAYWYSCQNVGEGKGLYSTSACNTLGGSKAFTWKKLGTSTSHVMKGVTPFTLKFTALATFEISCTTQKMESKIENPGAEESKSGAISFGTFTLSGCTVPAPAAEHCSVVGGQIKTIVRSGAGAYTPYGEEPRVEFIPNAGTTLFETSFSGCATAGFNGLNYLFRGGFTGILNSATSTLEFTDANSAITWGGNHVPFVGSSKIETKAGENLKLGA